MILDLWNIGVMGPNPIPGTMYMSMLCVYEPIPYLICPTKTSKWIHSFGS
jgi:hypothetical protein